MSNRGFHFRPSLEPLNRVPRSPGGG
jgi:hypothetical protein